MNGQPGPASTSGGRLTLVEEVVKVVVVERVRLSSTSTTSPTSTTSTTQQNNFFIRDYSPKLTA
jgi:hypothetical protein